MLVYTQHASTLDRGTRDRKNLIKPHAAVEHGPRWARGAVLLHDTWRGAIVKQVNLNG